MSTLRTIIEVLKIVLEAYRFLDEQISEANFRKNVLRRKKFHDEFREAERQKRLEMLRVMK